MNPIGQVTEYAFLRFVKGIVVLAMGVSIVIAVALAGFATYKYISSIALTPPQPKNVGAPAPVKLTAFIDRLSEASKSERLSSDQPRSKETAVDATKVTKPFFKEAKLIYQCSLDFANAVGQPITALQPDDESAQIEVIRTLIEHKDDRSDWVESLPNFVCEGLKNQQVIEFRKQNSRSGMLLPLIDYYRDALAKTRSQHALKVEQQEQEFRRRVVEFDDAIMKTQQDSTKLLLSGLIMLAVFMGLAMYLVFVRIEVNLRDLSVAIRECKRDQD